MEVKCYEVQMNLEGRGLAVLMAEALRAAAIDLESDPYFIRTGIRPELLEEARSILNGASESLLDDEGFQYGDPAGGAA